MHSTYLPVCPSTCLPIEQSLIGRLGTERGFRLLFCLEQSKQTQEQQQRERLTTLLWARYRCAPLRLRSATYPAPLMSSNLARIGYKNRGAASCAARRCQLCGSVVDENCRQVVAVQVSQSIEARRTTDFWAKSATERFRRRRRRRTNPIHRKVVASFLSNFQIRQVAAAR